ncbi:MAG: TonB-dependent receptor plug domain-containing protein, partial [Paludibacter sp.]|nr:TonB-dependent receptor plug domain-containing protein [Paludibacter sp.]
MKKHKSILTLLLMLSVFNVFAQDKTLIRGNIIASSDKQPLIGASVVEMNKDNRIIAGTVTNLDGDFSLFISDKTNKLVVSYVGFRKQEMVIGGNSNFRVSLEELGAISEVTVSARQKQSVGTLDIDERDISMAISKLNAEEIATLQVASIDEAMQGRMAGVDIVANAGDPGSGMSIRIRGTTSINGNNQPLIVVDGIPLETEIGSEFDFSTATEEEFSNLLNVAPTDIKEIVVLKDAAANAIWGSKAANGVLQITTIRGSISPPKVSLRITQTYKPEPASLPVLSGDEYTTLILESHLNSGAELDLLRNPEFANDPSNPYYFHNYSQNTDWIKAVTQTGYVQDYNLSVRGGSSKVRYAFSAGYYDDKGNTIETGFQRINTRMNLDYFVSDKLSFKADMSYTHSTTQRNYVPSDKKLESESDVRSHAHTKMPNQSIYEWTEFGEMTNVYFKPINSPQGNYPNVFNPVAMAREGRYDLISDLILPKLSLQYRPNSVWRYTFDVSLQTSNNKINKFLPESATGLKSHDNRQNAASDGDNESFTVQTFNKLYFTPQFKDEYKHRLIALWGLNTYERTSYSYQASSSNLASPYLQDPSIPSRTYPLDSSFPPTSSGSSMQRTMSTYVNVNYTLLDRYTVYGNLNLN